MLIIILLALFAIQKNKNKPIYEIGKPTKQEEIVQKIQRKLTVLKIEEETIYGTIKFESTIEDLEYVITPEENKIDLKKDTKELAVDYQLQNKQEYEFKVKAKGNSEEIIKIVVDKDAIPKIQIKQDNYAHIMAKGVELERIITMDKTEGFKTIYSFDNGKNWQEYTGEEVRTNQLVNSIIGKKVPIEDDDETITLEKYEKMPDLANDALGIPSYDYNESTTEIINGDRYIKVDEDIEGFKIQVQSNQTHNITFYKSDKSTQISTIANTGVAITIPKEARYLKVTKENPLKDIREIKIVPSVQFDETKEVIGQTKITVGVKANGFNGKITYEYYVDGGKKTENTQNIYQYTKLVPNRVYTIKVVARDEKGNTDQIQRSIQAKPDNSSIIGYITSDAVDASIPLYKKTAGGVEYSFEILYLDKNNISNYGTYNESTNTYTITKNMNIGTATKSQMAVLKCDGNLTINPNVTITTATYEETVSGENGRETYTTKGNTTKLKGLFICCMGTLTNNGIISQTARGAYTNGASEDVYLWADVSKSDSQRYTGYIVPSSGETGGVAPGGSNGLTKSGVKGNDGTGRQTGGGGSGATRQTHKNAYCKGGNGSRGTAYAGGSGGGGHTGGNPGSSYATDGTAGGAGGNGGSNKYNLSAGWPMADAGGGTGVTAGLCLKSGAFGNFGTGGLLIVYANTLINNGSIQSNGVDSPRTYGASGGASGGGSVNIFYTSGYSEKSSTNTTANGGIGGRNYNGNWDVYGGNGGNGTVSKDKITL